MFLILSIILFYLSIGMIIFLIGFIKNFMAMRKGNRASRQWVKMTSPVRILSFIICWPAAVVGFIYFKFKKRRV